MEADGVFTLDFVKAMMEDLKACFALFFAFFCYFFFFFAIFLHFFLLRTYKG